MQQEKQLSAGENVACPEGVLAVSVQSSADVDLCVLVLGQDGKVAEERDFVFYNATTHPSGAVELSPPAGSLRLDVSRLPATAERVVLAASIDEGAFHDLAVQISSPAGDSLTFDPPQLRGITAVSLLEVYRRAGGWKVRAVGQGWASGLAGLATDFGIAVDEDDDVPAPVPVPPTPERTEAVSEIRQLMEQRSKLSAEVFALRKQIGDAEAQLVQTDETALLQDLGFYQYSHPLDNAPAYKERLVKVRNAQKAAMRDGRAIRSKPGWTVNGSVKEGAALVADFSKLMLRAYNTEADNCVRSVRPHSLTAATKRLDQTRTSILKLGAIMGVAIEDGYHEMRVRELRLVTDHQAKLAEEKESAREERERAREDQKALDELLRQTEKIRRERSHYDQALARLVAIGDEAGAEKIRTEIAALDRAEKGIEERLANIRVGHVYVISNQGAFGKRIVKIGMTRRWDPMVRIHELGSASVPFRFDVHALIFSRDAVGLERDLHREFEERRVNRVNLRREFFYATPSEVRDVLMRVGEDHLLEFTETAEAVEWRQSEARQAEQSSNSAPHPDVHVRL